MTREQMQKIGYHAALLDVYHFLRRFGDEGTNDENFWDTVAMEARATAQKYKGTAVNELVNDLLLACLDEMQRTASRADNNGQNRKGGEL